MTVRPDLQEILDAVDAADRAAESLTRPLTDEQFHWQPEGGRSWSVAQCFDHLATSNKVYGAAMATALDEAEQQGWAATGPIASTVFGAWFVKSLEPPVKRRTRAPGKIQPRASGTRQDILRGYAEAHEGIRQLAMRADALDVNRATFSNPFLPLIRVRVGTGFRVICAHDRRHLWQAERVTTQSGFPATAR